MKNEPEIVKTPEKPYAFKLCECAVCGTVETCTFNFDFYAYEIDGKRLLRCERCLLYKEFGTAYPPKLTIYPDGTVEKENE